MFRTIFFIFVLSANIQGEIIIEDNFNSAVDKSKAKARQHDRQRAQERKKQYNSGTNIASGSITLCIPTIPHQTAQSFECRAKSASYQHKYGENATVRLTKDYISQCYSLNVYTGSGVGVGSTCSGVSSSWSVNVNGTSGFANDLSSAVSWLLNRM